MPHPRGICPRSLSLELSLLQLLLEVPQQVVVQAAARGIPALALKKVQIEVQLLNLGLQVDFSLPRGFQTCIKGVVGLLQFLHLGHAGLQSLLIESFVLLVICIQPLILVLEIQESVVEYIIIHAHSLHVLPDHVDICCALVIFRIELNVSDGVFVRRKALSIFIRIDLMRVDLSLTTHPLNAAVVHGLHHILGCLFDPLELI